MNNLFPSPTTKDKPESVVPLINVIFLLLIFFMIAGQLRSYELFEVEAPELNSHETLAEEIEILLIMDQTGQIALHDQLITIQELANTLADETEENHTTITVKIDKHTANKHLTDLLEQLQIIKPQDINLLVTQRSD